MRRAGGGILRILGERGGISDFAGFIFIIVGLVVVPFMYSMQIFQYYYIQTLYTNAAALTLRVAEVGYSEQLLPPNATTLGPASTDARTQRLNAIFLNNLKMQGIDESLPGGHTRNTQIVWTSVARSPFIRMRVTAEVVQRYAILPGTTAATGLPLQVTFTGRKTMLDYNAP